MLVFLTVLHVFCDWLLCGHGGPVDAPSPHVHHATPPHITSCMALTVIMANAGDDEKGALGRERARTPTRTQTDTRRTRVYAAHIELANLEKVPSTKGVFPEVTKMVLKYVSINTSLGRCQGLLFYPIGLPFSISIQENRQIIAIGAFVADTLLAFHSSISSTATSPSTTLSTSWAGNPPPRSLPLCFGHFQLTGHVSIPLPVWPSPKSRLPHF